MAWTQNSVREACIRKFVSYFFDYGCEYHFSKICNNKEVSDWAFKDGVVLSYKQEHIAIIHKDEETKKRVIVIVQPSFKKGVDKAIEYLKNALNDYGIPYCYLPLAEMGIGVISLGWNRVPYIINKVQIQINNDIYSGNYTKKERRELYANVLDDIAYFAWDNFIPSFNQNMDRGEMEGTRDYLRSPQARYDAIKKTRQRKISQG